MLKKFYIIFVIIYFIINKNKIQYNIIVMSIITLMNIISLLLPIGNKKNNKDDVCLSQANTPIRPNSKINNKNEELQKHIDKGYSKKLCEDMNKIEDKCKESKSFNKNLNVLKDLINKSIESKKYIEIIFKNILKDTSSSNELINLLTPSGTKGKFSGDILEELILEEINNIVNKLYLNKKIQIHFQENNKQYPTSEKPDIWIQYEDKTIIFMIQKDLWGGGQQSNRCEKYLNNNKYNNNNVKLICVVSEYLNIDSFKNKKNYDLLCKSIENKKLCWINHLEKNIIEFFNIKSKKS